ncbi:hypothetical protein ACNI3K_05280 [Demequina sp. SO4-13]|uniref:hypothetical protein n=1 Tax=Demequina sp. SO4-13 TaxID=3401027 RepID=UPI003AF6052E
MAKSNRESTEELKRLAEEVERERQEKGALPFDDTSGSEDEDPTTREDHAGDVSPLSDTNDPTRAGAVGSASRIRGPVL